MIITNTLTTPLHIEVSSLDAKTLHFLRSLPDVQVHPLARGRYRVVVPRGVKAKRMASDPNGNDTWLYRFRTGQILGHDTEGAMVPVSVWPATSALWRASSEFKFAQICYEENLAAGLISPDTLPPDPADYQ